MRANTREHISNMMKIIRMVKPSLITCLLLLIGFSCFPKNADAADLNAAVTWLMGKQNEDGSWGKGGSALRDTMRVVEALKDEAVKSGDIHDKFCQGKQETSRH